MSGSVVDFASFASSGGGAWPNPYTMGAYSRRALLAFYEGKSGAPWQDPRPVAGSVQYAGLALTFLGRAATNNGAGVDWISDIWYLLNPPTGLNTFTLTPTAASYKVLHLATGSGINQAAPFGAFVISAPGVAALSTLLPASSEGEIVLDSICVENPFTTTPTPTAPQTTIGSMGSGGATPIHGGVSQRAGGPLSSMTWTWAPASDFAHIAVAIKAQVETYRRPVEYTYDIWEANPQVRDAAGRVVPPQQVRSNRWMRLLGARQPTSERPLSFVDDDQIAYIESVRYDGGSGTLSIQTSRGEFGEIIVARAAGKSTA